MSTRTFICQHCQRRVKKNPRLKGKQHYCGRTACQQARKDKWERDRLGSDPAYRDKRSGAKKNWYRGYPGDRYQHQYRQEHGDYTKSNRCNQQKRDKKITGKPSVAKIVKTDALSSKNLVPRGLYVLLPYEKTDGKKIVKTDALIVELRSCGDFREIMLSGTG
ncbi:MAG: hypothetical protein WC319_10450 [Candidatus Paceibacterota bacterium]|jgi:hypothetical protein